MEAEFVFRCQGLICHGSFSQSCCRAKINIKDFSVLSTSQSQPESGGEENEVAGGCCDVLELHHLLLGCTTGLHRPTQGHYGRGSKKVFFEIFFIIHVI